MGALFGLDFSVGGVMVVESAVAVGACLALSGVRVFAFAVGGAVVAAIMAAICLSRKAYFSACSSIATKCCFCTAPTLASAMQSALDILVDPVSSDMASASVSRGAGALSNLSLECLHHLLSSPSPVGDLKK